MIPRLSVAMIVKDEESCLGMCLESVRDADEIVVVDTGSTDRTKEIAAGYTDRIHDWPWRDDFAAARNQALRHATGDWVLSIDADEVLEAGGMDRLRRRVASETHRTLSLEVVAAGTGASHWFPRAFRREPGIFWRGAIHETLSVVEDNRGDVRITYGSSAAHAKDPDRSLRILRREVARDPSATREVFYLAREYWYRGDFASAAHWYGDYLTRATWHPEMADAHLMLARCHWALSRGAEARGHCLQAIGLNPDFREALLFMSEITWPETARRWREMADTASNRGVLFVRA